MVKALLHGKITNNEEIVIIKSGKKRLISVNAKPLRDDRGEITGALAILEDITERKKSEQKLTENEERLNMAQKIAHMGSWEYFANQDKAIWSEELFNIFRLKPQTYGPNVTTYAKLIHPQDREEINRVMEKLLFNAKTGDIASFDYRILTPDNSVRTLHSIRMVREVDENGKTARIMGIELDVTDRRIAEEELNATKKHLSNEVHWLNKLQEINTLLSTEQKYRLTPQNSRSFIEFTHADTGNLQLVTKENELKTVAQHG